MFKISLRTTLIALPIAILLPVAVLAQTFPDVPTNHPQYGAIESLVRSNIVDGYPDGTFQPSNSVQRVEALKMILLSADISVPEEPAAEDFTNLNLSDVPAGEWFTNYIIEAKKQQIVHGNPDGTFQPARQVNKAEFIKMTLEAFDQDLSKHQDLQSQVANDVQATDWFAPYMSYAKTIGVISPDLSDNLYPSHTLNRAESAEILYKMLIVAKGGEIQKYLSIAESKIVDLLVKINLNKIDEALTLADEAVFYSEKALEIDPDKGIVKAAHKIVLGFQKLTQAYKAGLDGDYEAVQSLVTEAKDYAGQAYNDDPSTQPFGKKIKEQGDVLLSQISQITNE